MTTIEFITELFYLADEKLKTEKQHPQAKLSKSEIVTLALLFALKGANTRHFYRWLVRDYLPLFPRLPERTRLFRLFKQNRLLANQFLADPSILGVADSFGIEMCHPVREKRFPDRKRLGKKGKSNSRWIVGGKLCVVLNKFGLVCGFQTATANVYDTEFHALLEEFEKEMVICTDTGFHSKDGNPRNVKICKRGTWNERMIVESVFSLITRCCQGKQMRHRVWECFEMRLGFLLAIFNILQQWNSLNIDKDKVTHLSMAEFAL